MTRAEVAVTCVAWGCMLLLGGVWAYVELRRIDALREHTKVEAERLALARRVAAEGSDA